MTIYEEEGLVAPPTAEEIDQLLKDITHEEHELAVLDLQYRAMIAPHKHRLSELKATFEPLAEAYARASGKKTNTLWHGTLRLRRTAPRLAIENEEEAIRWSRAEMAAEDNEFVETVEKLNRKAFIAYLTQHGLMADGVQFLPEGESFSYQTPTPKISDILEDENN